jgi:ribosomal-protein-alanine N-acetyltransferase
LSAASREPRELPEIRTGRLLLRPLMREDLEAIHRIWTDPEVRRYLWDGERIPKEKAEAVLAGSIESFESRGFGIWGVVYDESEELVGFCGFRSLDDTPEIELLYGISTPQWGMGLATEAARAAIRFGFEEVGFDRILGIANTENVASRRVLGKIGMRFEKSASHEGRDETHYAIRREEFRPADAYYAVRRT